METCVFVERDGLQLAPGKKVIKAHEYAIFLEAEKVLKRADSEADKLITDAKQQAGSIVTEAKNQAKAIKKQANKDAAKKSQEAAKAFDVEKQRGYDEGLEAGKANISLQMMDTVTRCVNYFSEFEDRISAAVIAAVKKIIGNMDTDELVVKMVHNVLSVVRGQNQVLVRVAPSQFDFVRTKIQGMTSPLQGIKFVEVIPDMRLKEGDCIIENEIGVIEASLDTQLEAIQKAVGKCFKRKADSVEYQLQSIERMLLKDVRKKKSKKVVNLGK